MNSGYLALIIIWFTILFTWMGCFDRFFQQYQINKKWTLVFLCLTLIGTGLRLPLPYKGQLFLITFLLPLLIAGFLWIRLADSNRVHLLTASFLVGTSIFLLRLLLQIDPILMVMDETYMQVCLILFLTNVATRGPVQQYILLVFGLTFAEIGSGYYLWEKTNHYQLGSYAYSDLSWLTFAFLAMFRWVLNIVKRPSILRRKRAQIS